ncbi:KPN_02809 family neutral zinc metallopeptidase [Nocardia stercoris]|uniref:Metalloprotease n=1 Tax=Nocardia stercoris TaxID=2483361 RepID=A0A3M2KYQ9_9NOCA|nr:neutral zinc metallopeptidase [Nocardia stercoris]RMI30627.1 hypothetical protein EBN03_21435 [Nocardia stercoris]
MTFNDGMQLNTDGVSTSSGGGGLGPGGMMLGGGGGLIVLVIALLFGVNPGNITSGLTGGNNSSQSGAAPDISMCKTGADANRNVNCRVVATANSVNTVWSVELPKQTGVQYVPPKVRLFTGSVSTGGCGTATSAVGPFYCPADRTAYFDTGFFQELKDRFGGSNNPLAQEYVVAHEFGHHVQNLLGDSNRASRDPKGPQSGSVRMELQADCYAGIWAGRADKQAAPGSNQPFLQPITQAQLQDALSAAAAVGDDRIQKAATGRVNPESWTHGSSDERQKWFMVGYKTSNVKMCDTFSVPDVSNPPAVG